MIVGGPPCPTFSRIGRAKINKEANRDLGVEASVERTLFLEDERNHLYTEYLRFVKEVCPLVVVMENVGPFLSQAGTSFAPGAAASSLKELVPLTV